MNSIRINSHLSNSQKIRMLPAQVLVIIILIMSVALTIGVAISSRVILTLKQTTFSEQSSQALSFAEAGAEEALYVLKTTTPFPPLPLTSCLACPVGPQSQTGGCGAGGCDCDPAPVNFDGVSGNDYNYCIESLGNSQVLADIPQLKKDEVFQVSLSGYPPNTPLEVYWTRSDPNSEEDDEDRPLPRNAEAALELTLVYEFASGDYRLIKEAYDPVPYLNRGLSASNGLCSVTHGTYDPDPPGGQTYEHKILFNNSSLGSGTGCEGGVAGGNVPAGAQLLRIRALYNTVPNSIVISAPPGGNIPAQGAKVVSTGFSGLVQRTVEVVRTVPALAGIFDYVLFSGSESQSLQK